MKLKFWEKESPFKTEVSAIHWAANEVHRHLGSGFFERVYQEALEQEFRIKKIPFVREGELRVKYKNIFLPSHYAADFICFDKIVVEVRVVNRFTREHRAQLIHYLKVCDLDAGLMLNFGNKSLQVKKYIR